MAHPGGRPLKYKSVEELKENIKAYFDSLWEEHWVMELDNNKNPTGKWIQIHDRNGNPVMKMKEQPTITGLAIYLGTSRETLMEYQERDEYFEVIKGAKDLCEYYTEKGVTQGEMHVALGIFKLKNYGWTDETKVTVNTSNDNLSDDDIEKALKGRKKMEDKGNKE